MLEMVKQMLLPHPNPFSFLRFDPQLADALADTPFFRHPLPPPL